MKKQRYYALVEEGKLCHYYSLAFIFFTRKHAENEKRWRNQCFEHKMKVVEVEIGMLVK